MIRFAKLSITAFVLLLFVALPDQSRANSTYRNAWKAAYPSACATLLSAVSNCTLCHVDGTPPDVNPYGTDLIGHSSSITATNNLDSDHDGKTNIQEINDCTLPGDPNSVPNDEQTWGQIKSLYR
jgi:hypothetical protein